MVCLALFFAGAMAVTALAMLATPANADSIIPSTSTFRIVYVPATMAPPSDAYPPVYEKDTDGSYFLLGEGDGVRNYATVGASQNTLSITLVAMNAWQVNNTYLNITNYDQTIFDFADADSSNLEVMGAGSPVNFMTGTTPWGNGTASHSFTWTFDVLKTAGLGADTSTELTLRAQYATDTNTAPTTVSDIHVRIYISSIFDDPASITHENPPNVNETVAGTEDVAFEAGDAFAEGNITFHNFDNAVDGNILNLDAVLTVPTTTPVNQIACFGGNAEAKNNSGIPNGGTSGLKWRFNIAQGTLPGIYPGSVAITYTRGGMTINEGSRVTNWTVDYNFRDTNSGSGDGWSRNQCWASSVTIVDNGEQQGARSADSGATRAETNYKVSVTIENGGGATGGSNGRQQYKYALPLAFVGIVGICLQMVYWGRRSKK